MLGTLADFQRRDTGNLPVSVGTSLAIEGLQASGLPPFDYVWVNLRTLYRNLIASVDTATRDMADPYTVGQVMVEEMEHIRDAVLTLTQGRIHVQWYLSNPATLVKALPDAIIRSPQTDLQKHVDQLCNAALEYVVKTVGKEHVLQFSPLLQGPGRTLALTHMPTDLLNHRSFAELMLLESHTGKIKRYAEFNTKFTNGSDLTHIPYNGFTLTIFGDNNVLLRQAPGKLRKAILDIAQKYNWTAMTTREKIRYGISNITDTYAKQALLGMLSKTTY